MNTILKNVRLSRECFTADSLRQMEMYFVFVLHDHAVSTSMTDTSNESLDRSTK
jgi:hypothetical protein